MYDKAILRGTCKMDTTMLMPIALLVLVIVGVWTVVELALTVRSTRHVVDNLGARVDETLAEVTPIVAKLDGVVDSIDPAIKQIDPLLQKAGMTVDALTVDLMRVDEVLADVSSITGTASNATASAQKTISGVTGRASGLIERITGKKPTDDKTPQPAKLEAPAAPVVAPAPQPEASAPSSYFTYPGGAAPAAAAAPAVPLEDTGVLKRDDVDAAAQKQQQVKTAAEAAPTIKSDFSANLSDAMDADLLAWLNVDSAAPAAQEAAPTAAQDEEEPVQEEVQPAQEDGEDPLSVLGPDSTSDSLAEWLDESEGESEEDNPIVIPRGKPKE